MTRHGLIKGELQEQIMRVIWLQGPGGVEDVRRALPKPGAYTTVQTVLNRLAEHGLLDRQKLGNAFRYSATLSEADYLARSLSETLAGASEAARRGALASLVGDLKPEELSEVRKLARNAERKRRG